MRSKARPFLQAAMSRCGWGSSFRSSSAAASWPSYFTRAVAATTIHRITRRATGSGRADDSSPTKVQKRPLLAFASGACFPYRPSSLGFLMRLSPAVLACLVSIALSGVTPAAAQGKQRNLAERCAKPDFAKNNPKTCAQFAKPADAAKQPERPTRPDFTADD